MPLQSQLSKKSIEETDESLTCHLERGIASILVLLYILAHALTILSLLAFGFQAGGWVLHPVAVAWYSLFVLGSFLLLLRSWRAAVSPSPLVEGSRRGVHWLPVLPPILALALAGAFPATGAVGGAAYAPYGTGDVHEWFVGLNILGTLALTALALLYRRPRLLLAWARMQGLLLLTYPAWWAYLWRWGGLGNILPTLALIGGPPLLYALALGALGMRLPRRWGRWVLAGLAVGVGMAVLAGIRHAAYVEARGLTPSETWPGFVMSVPLLLAFGALLAPLPLLARQMLREQPVLPPHREEPEGGSRRFPWEALALLLWTSASIASHFLGNLPTAGDVQGWVSLDHVVPDAWLPTITWAGWLFTAVRWLSLPLALWGLADALRRTRPRLTFPGFPQVLLWAGMGWLASFAWDISRLGFPLGLAWETHSAMDAFLHVPGGVFLLLAGRVAERRMGPWGRWLWRWMTVGGLLALLMWTGRAAWVYGRVLLSPLPAWADRWQYAPLPRVPLSALGLAVHLGLLGLGLFALAGALRAWWAQASVERPRPLVWPVALLLLAFAVLAGLGWWATAPPVVRTVPVDGATGVPRDTVVHIEMGAKKEWLELLLGRSGQGIRTRYADTGEYIPGMSGGSMSGFLFDPEGLLRPDAPVEITVYRTGERPYTLHFTTAGVDSPTATPMPDAPLFPGPVPTESIHPTPTPAAHND